MTAALPELGLTMIAVSVIMNIGASATTSATAAATCRCLSFAAMSGNFFALAAYGLVHGTPVIAVVGVVLAGVCAWLAWETRPPRRRRPSRVAARVKNVGHKLVVVPARAEAS